LEEVNYHTLADFRVEKRQELDDETRYQSQHNPTHTAVPLPVPNQSLAIGVYPQTDQQLRIESRPPVPATPRPVTYASIPITHELLLRFRNL